MKITGGCHCKNVAYEAYVNEEVVVICHCTDCQRLSASSYRISVVSAEQNFKLLNNEPKIYIKTTDSGTPRIQAFCSECGSSIYATSVNDVGHRNFNIRLGTVDEIEKFSPTKQIWSRSAQPWAFNLENIPRVETQS